MKDQIEEMRRDLVEIFSEEYDKRNLITADNTAEKMLAKGYRKQSVGEWKKRVFIVFDSEIVGYRCSECNTTWDAPTKVCPNCGAKMKGGAEQ